MTSARINRAGLTKVRIVHWLTKAHAQRVLQRCMQKALIKWFRTIRPFDRVRSATSVLLRKNYLSGLTIMHLASNTPKKKSRASRTFFRQNTQFIITGMATRQGTTSDTFWRINAELTSPNRSTRNLNYCYRFLIFAICEWNAYIKTAIV